MGSGASAADLSCGQIVKVAWLTLLAAVGLALAAPLMAMADSVRFNIAPQPLPQALKAFAAQAHMQLLYEYGAVARAKGNAVIGDLEKHAALEQLLKNSGLEVIYSSDSAATIRPIHATAASSVKADDPRGSQPPPQPAGDSFQLAQLTPGQASSSSTVEKQDQESSEKKKEQIQEVIVTGSRIPTEAREGTLPVRSYTHEDIERSGETTIGEFISTLPEVSTYYSNPAFQLGVPGAQAIQLHGLPVGTTLTLLDGRRVETGLFGFFDLSNIPLAAVERIEVLPVGASAIYGADALAGAVNTILRKDFDGLEANATWNHASDLNNSSASLAWGKTWDRGSVSIIGSYQEIGALLGTEREPLSLTHFPIKAPASTVTALSTDICAPGTVYSTDGSNLPGLSSPEAGIPAGITGKPTIGEFAATAGRPNLCNDYAYGDITPASHREAALLTAHYELAPSVQFFTEVLLSRGTVTSQLFAPLLASSLFDGTVAANNPYNPFGEAVNVSFSNLTAKFPELQSQSLARPLIGLQGSIFSDWHYEATAYFSRDQLHQTEPTLDVPTLAGALSSSSFATALNPFASGAPGSPQLLNSLFPATDTFRSDFDDRLAGGQALLRGPLLKLPVGTVQAAIGGEYGQEKIDSSFTGVAPSLLSRHTYALFSEVRVPVLAGGEQEKPSEHLTLTLAGRYDHSNDYGGKATGQGGLLWRASETLSFTGSYGLSYRAPRLSEISGPQSVTPGAILGVPDALRGNQPIDYPVIAVSGPNSKLRAETGDSLTLELQYSSAALPGLHSSLTWYDLKITNYIGLETLNALIAYPNLFPGAVLRAPPTPQDQQLGFAGLITQINDTYYNFGDLHLTGLDADLSYAIDTSIGQLTPSLSIASVYRWQSALLPGAPPIDGVSRATNTAFGGGAGWSPRWKGTAALAWKAGPLSASLAGRYVSRYLDDQEFVPNTNEIGNTWVFDLNARYEPGRSLASSKSWLAGSYIDFGAVNLFDKIPPFSYSPFWYDIQEYDIRGRFLHLTAGVRF